MDKKENIEALVSQVMRSITQSTKFWSQAWKDEFASRLASEVEAHLTLRAKDTPLAEEDEGDSISYGLSFRETEF